MRTALISILFFFISYGVHSQVGFPYCEPFDGSTTQSETVFGGDASLVNGALRLTENTINQTGYVYIDIPFPSVFGIKAEFEYFSYGGDNVNRADGLVMFLFDAATTNFAPGAFGGSLGYAQRNGSTGLSNGYLGIGFDEFGNFGNFSEGKIGGFPGSGIDLVPDAVVIRGPGNGNSGYEFLVGRKTMEVGNDGLNPGAQFPISSGGVGTQRVTDPNQPGYRKVFIDLQPNLDGDGYFLTVEMMVTTVPNSPRMVTVFDRPYGFQAPENLKIGFAASTGGFTNYHEIKNLIVQVSNDDALVDPEGVDFSDFASCEGQENTYFITDEEVVLPNENSVIRCLQFYASLEDIEEENNDICSQARCREENRVLQLPQGTFRAGDNAGDFTFFPNEGFTDEEVTVYYTLTDSYGKTSSGNSMTLTIQESPAPVTLKMIGSAEESDVIRLCPDDEVTLEAVGEEDYFRFEWYKDEVLIESENQSTYLIAESGIYNVVGYNRKNCPAISENVIVDYPPFPVLTIDSPLVGCTPGQTVNVSEAILNFDLENYDYLLSGLGQTWENEEMYAVAESGIYDLQIKHKDLTCYSEIKSLEVIILEEELTANFDFVVEGTDIKGDDEGGIFPDDMIAFTDLSDQAVSWEWDFGDGSSISTEQNPLHVFGKKGSFQITLTITNSLGCEASFTKQLDITRSYRVMIPTGFTPLLSENNTFLPKFKGLISIEILIFNSWGDLIFQTDDLNTEGWDGNFLGELADSGFYVYRFNGVSTDGEKVTEAGKFRLIR